MVECNFRTPAANNGEQLCDLKDELSIPGTCDEENCIFIKMLEPVKERMELAWKEVLNNTLKNENEQLIEKVSQLTERVKDLERNQYK